jgi:hypothetical protein
VHPGIIAREMRDLVWGLLLVVGGCGFPRPADVGDDAGPVGCRRTTCSADQLVVCGDNGLVDHTEVCALGCFDDGTRCNQVAPSNGLADSVDRAASQPIVTLPSGSVIDTDTGIVTAAGNPIVIASATVAQTGGATIRVFLAKSWMIRDVRVRGSMPVAFVASDELRVEGVIDASADGAAAGPGALVCGALAGGGVWGAGFFSRARVDAAAAGYPAFIWNSNGGGGAGFGTPGGIGGISLTGIQVGGGGVVNGTAELVPLRGGCEGGGDASGATTVVHRGAGGGALQLVSARTIHLVVGASVGAIHVGGGGGSAGLLGKVDTTDTSPVWGPGGGGSGGGILLEAPAIVLDDATLVLAVGGGGGGYGLCTPGPNGLDAPASRDPAAGGSCASGTLLGVAGGDGSIAGDGGMGASQAVGSSGGGGGGLGRIRINTSDGQYTTGPTTLVRGAVTTGLVGRR